MAFVRTPSAAQLQAHDALKRIGGWTRTKAVAARLGWPYERADNVLRALPAHGLAATRTTGGGLRREYRAVTKKG